MQIYMVSFERIPLPIGSMYGIFTYIYHKNQSNVGKYTSPMDPMGYNFVHEVWGPNCPIMHDPWNPGASERASSQRRIVCSQS